LIYDGMHRGLLHGAVWSTLTMGALFGAFNLAVVHLHLWANPPSHNQTHAGFQLWAFAFLLTAPASRPRLVLWGTLAAQLLVGYGRVGDVLPFGVPALLAGAALQLAVAVSTRAWGWIAAAGLLAASAVDASLDGDIRQAWRWNGAIYAVALFGAAWPAVMGGARLPRLLAWIGAAVMATASFLRWTRGVDVGLLVAAASAIVFSVRAPALGVAKGGLHLFALAALVNAISGHGMAFDAARHAFTLGVLTPVLLGAPRPAAILLLAGATLRQAQTVAALAGAPEWLWVSAASGVVALAGVVLASVAALRRGGPARP
jgi:hypothetical protein